MEISAAACCYPQPWYLKPPVVITVAFLQAMGIQRYLFFSIFGCDRHPEVPLMAIKAATEKYLAASGVPATTLRLCE